MIFEKDIAFLDIESTGTNTQEDRIIELAVTILHPDMTRESRFWKVNPGIPIPESSSKIHGILDEHVKGLPLFCEVANEVYEFIKGKDLGGFNSNRFDIPMLYNHLLLCGITLDYQSVSMLDVGNLFKIKEERTLTAGVRFYLGREHDGAHGAVSDTEATVDIFLAQLDKYTDLPESVSEMSLYTNYGNRVLDVSGKFSFDEDGDYVFTFGPKTKGVKVKNDLSFLDWMLTKANFPPDTQKVGWEIKEEILNPKSDWDKIFNN